MAVVGSGAVIVASEGGGFPLLGILVTVVLWVVGVVVALALTASLLLALAVSAVHLYRWVRR